MVSYVAFRTTAEEFLLVKREDMCGSNWDDITSTCIQHQCCVVTVKASHAAMVLIQKVHYCWNARRVSYRDIDNI